MNLSDRLHQLLEERGMAQYELAELIGVSQPAIQKILNGSTKKPRNLLDIANALGVDPYWLQNGTEVGSGGVYISGNAKLSQSSVIAPTNNFFGNEQAEKMQVTKNKKLGEVKRLDLSRELGEVALNDEISGLFDVLSFTDSGLIELLKISSIEGLKFVTMFNDSMSPTIEKKDLVFINTRYNKYLGEGIYLFLMNGEVYIRRLYQTPDGILKAEADNERIRERGSFEITSNNLERIKILGKCVRVIKMTVIDL